MTPETLSPEIIALLSRLSQQPTPQPSPTPSPDPWNDPSLLPDPPGFQPGPPAMPVAPPQVDPNDPMALARELEERNRKWSEHPWIMKLRGLLGGADPGRY